MTLALAAGLSLSACVTPVESGYQAPAVALPPRPVALDAYAWLDRADALLDAIADAPPDFTFDHGGRRHFAWRVDEVLIVEETSADACVLYLFEEGQETPFFVRTPVQALGFDGRELAVVYTRDGDVLTDRDAWYAAADAQSLQRRGRDIRLAAWDSRWDRDAAEDWVAVEAFIVATRDAWVESWRRDREWERYRARAEADASRARLGEERRRRREAGSAFRRWRQGGAIGTPPGLRRGDRDNRPGRDERPSRPDPGVSRPDRPDRPRDSGVRPSLPTPGSDRPARPDRGGRSPQPEPVGDPRAPVVDGGGRPARPDTGNERPTRPGRGQDRPERPERPAPTPEPVIIPDPIAVPPGPARPNRGPSERPRPVLSDPESPESGTARDRRMEQLERERLAVEERDRTQREAAEEAQRRSAAQAAADEARQREAEGARQAEQERRAAELAATQEAERRAQLEQQRAAELAAAAEAAEAARREREEAEERERSRPAQREPETPSNPE